MNKIKEAELLFAKLEELSKQANMSPREYILEKGTVEEGSADWAEFAKRKDEFTMKDMSFMIFYIQPHWNNQIVMMLKSYFDFTGGYDNDLEKIVYVVWRNDDLSRLDKAIIDLYDLELETSTINDRWAAHNNWVYLDLNDALHKSAFLNWKYNPLERGK